MFESLTTALANGGSSQRRQYSPEQARELFHADWAAASIFDVNPAFSPSHHQGLLVALHGTGRADAYLIFLYADADAAKSDIRTALDSLTFLPGNSKAQRAN